MRASQHSADPARGTRRWITAALVVGGAIGGAAVGALITPLGKILGGAPPADLANYLVNVRAFALMGALVGPVVTWSALRHVPLWRTIAEPLLGSLLGAGLGVLLGSGALFLTLVPLGGLVAATRLGLAHRSRLLSGSG